MLRERPVSFGPDGPAPPPVRSRLDELATQIEQALRVRDAVRVDAAVQQMLELVAERLPSRPASAASSRPAPGGSHDR